MVERDPITASGAEVLREELKRLKMVERPKITDAIAEARAHGDLKENAEYHAAREQQGMNEARIKQIEGVISNAQIIDVTTLPQSGKVVFGTTVTICDVESDKEVTYTIVGELEANIDEGKISVTSPIARALIGQEVGAEVTVQAPGGVREYEILNIEYK